jgi:uncharacterized membrane protein
MSDPQHRWTDPQPAAAGTGREDGNGIARRVSGAVGSLGRRAAEQASRLPGIGAGTRQDIAAQQERAGRGPVPFTRWARRAADSLRSVGTIAQPRGPSGQWGVAALIERALGTEYREPDQRVAASLGAFSLALGAGELFAPRLVAAVAGIRRGPLHRLVLRALGLRELATGVGIFATTDPAPLIWARAGGDAIDLWLLRKALKSGRNGRVRVAFALLVVAGVAAADVAAAVRSTRAGMAGADRLEDESAVTVNRPVDEVFAFWRQLDRLPSFMANVQSVELVGPDRSHWRAVGPAGRALEWDAEITAERPGELIAWRSVPGSDVDASGEVRFRPAPGERGTEVVARMRYAAPGGRYGVAAARLLGESPPYQLREDLRRFKQVMETGSVVLSEGAPIGTSLTSQLRQSPAQPGETHHGQGASTNGGGAGGRGPAAQGAGRGESARGAD